MFERSEILASFLLAAKYIYIYIKNNVLESLIITKCFHQSALLVYVLTSGEQR